ncbi:hypothetical protein AQUCO_01100546v1 [Aquilegia coerulea]|uniref:PABS domain-containing protein n=1 Tax=Aquilegia coerulea TaxID=218851 RepID=A0A2G5E7L3_AQUCA|nr:hypothetical protein AQUCO_01100546v1 [Aquilegia coerulea]
MSSLPHQIRPLNLNPIQTSRLFVSTYPNNLKLSYKITPRSTQLQRLTSKSQETHLINTQNKSQEDGISSDHAKVLAKFKSKYNHIRVIEVSRRADHPFAGSRLLLLDKPGNIHSISFLFKQFTNTYFDVFATFPPIIPPGPLGILGFGAGSAAHLILELYPQVSIHGWELDPSVISVGRKFFDLSKLEEENPNRLFVYIGDALEANVEDGFSGILVDMFCKGSLIPELQDRRTWEKLKSRLRKGGRIMVNVAGSCVESEDLERDGKLVMEETLKAMHCVFADQVFVLSLGNRKEDSSIALTGSLPDLDAWKQVLPPALRCYVNMWTPLSKMITTS